MAADVLAPGCPLAPAMRRGARLKRAAASADVVVDAHAHGRARPRLCPSGVADIID